jgi:sugar/nucleoside kinase (ribokinase family)
MGVLAVVGHTARDVVDSRPAQPGGVPFYAARALHALAERAVIVTRCAEADRSLIDPLRALGLPVVWRPASSSAAFRHTYRDGVRGSEIDSLGDPWTPGDVRGWAAASLADADWVHAGALCRGDFPADTLTELARGRRLSFDGQGLVRSRRTGPVELDGTIEPGLLAAVDVLHLAEEEAAALNVGLDERSLASLGVPEVLVTLGERGAVVYADGLAEFVRATPVATPDTTGAGDAFTAVYVACRRRNHAPAAAARRAMALVRELLLPRRRR